MKQLRLPLSTRTNHDPATIVAVTICLETDSQLWMSTNVRKKVIKDWRVEYTQHLRFENNISDVQSVMPEFELATSQSNPLDEDWVSIYL